MLFAVKQCTIAVVMHLQLDNAINSGDINAQTDLALYNLACEVTSEDELGGRLTIHRCLIDNISKIAECEFNLEITTE